MISTEVKLLQKPAKTRRVVFVNSITVVSQFETFPLDYFISLVTRSYKDSTFSLESGEETFLTWSKFPLGKKVKEKTREQKRRNKRILNN